MTSKSILIYLAVVCSPLVFASSVQASELDCASDGTKETVAKIATGIKSNPVGGPLAMALLFRDIKTCQEAPHNQKIQQLEADISSRNNKIATLKKKEDELERQLEGSRKQAGLRYGNAPQISMKASPQEQAKSMTVVSQLAELDQQIRIVDAALTQERQHLKPISDELAQALSEFEASCRQTLTPDGRWNQIKYTLSNIRLQERNKETKKLSCKAIIKAQHPDLSETQEKEIDYTIEVNSEGQFYIVVYGLGH